MKEESYAKMLTAMEHLREINQVLVSEAITSVSDLLDTIITDECGLYGKKETDMPDDEYWKRNEAFDGIILNPVLSTSEKAALLKQKELDPAQWGTTLERREIQ